MLKSVVIPSFLDWSGKISAVLFLGGCNFRCPYCHNYPIAWTPDQFPDAELATPRLDWIDGFVISGGEPTIHSTLPTFIKDLRDRFGLPIKLDTNGSNPAMLKHLIDEGLVESISMDVKAPLVMDKYSVCCGVSPPPLGEIEQSIQLLKDSPIDHEFRITPYPELNLADIDAIKRYTTTLKVQVLRQF